MWICLALAAVLAAGAVTAALAWAGILDVPVLSQAMQALGRGDDSLDGAVDAAMADLLSGGGGGMVLDGTGSRIDSLAGGAAAQTIMGAITYSVLDSAREDGGLTAQIAFTVPDTVALAAEYADLEGPQADFPAWLLDRLEEDPPTVELTIPVRFVQQDGGLAVAADSALYNVLTGGALDWYTQRQRQAYEALTGGGEP